MRGRTLLPTEYAGSFVLLMLSYVAGIVLISFHRDEMVSAAEQGGAGRPLREILRSPVVILAICSAAVAYGVMSLLMTATPISMHAHAGHGLEATADAAHAAGSQLTRVVLDVTDRVAMVSGASRGIGRAVAELLGVDYPIVQAPMGWIARSRSST